MAASPGGIPADLQGKHRPLPGHQRHMESASTGPARSRFAVPGLAEPLFGSSSAAAAFQGGSKQGVGREGCSPSQSSHACGCCSGQKHPQRTGWILKDMAPATWFVGAAWCCSLPWAWGPPASWGSLAAPQGSTACSPGLAPQQRGGCVKYRCSQPSLI